MNRCDICTHDGDCLKCMWYEGPRFWADNTVMFKDLFVMSPSKATAMRLNETEFHCGVEESGGHAYNCNDCQNKCEEWYQRDNFWSLSK